MSRQKYNLDSYHALKLLTNLFKAENIPWQIHAGFALHLLGIGGDTNDIDLVLYKTDLPALFKKIPGEFSKELITPKVQFVNGWFNNHRITLRYKSIKIDICSTLMTYTRGRYYDHTHPPESYTEGNFHQVKYWDLTLPVARAEHVIVYKRILNRKDSIRNDSEEITRCLLRGDIESSYLLKLVNNLHAYDEFKDILTLLRNIQTKPITNLFYKIKFLFKDLFYLKPAGKTI